MSRNERHMLTLFGSLIQSPETIIRHLLSLQNGYLLWSMSRGGKGSKSLRGEAKAVPDWWGDRDLIGNAYIPADEAQWKMVLSRAEIF
jgi:hypothetical protein